MQRAATVLLAVALLAPLFPVPLIAQEAATATPDTLDVSGAPETEIVTSSTPNAVEAGTTAPLEEEPTLLESGPFEEPEEPKVTQVTALQASGGPVIFSNTSTAEPISVIGFSGGAYLYLSQQITALASGTIEEMDLSLSQFSGGNSRSIRLDIYDESGTQFRCSVLNIGEAYAPGLRVDQWNMVPFEEAAPELLTLLPTDNVGDPGGCDLIEGDTYTVKLGISASSVNGTARLYTVGNAPEGFYFIARGAAPPPPLCTENCYSNVLFLPGIQGSALKEGDDIRWPSSLMSEDVSRLALTETGESVNDIKVAGVIGEFVPGVDVYGDFSSFMDSLVTDGAINEWVPYAYDWRLSLTETLEEGSEQADSTENVLLVEEIGRLAEDSKSGKVTIVAHSMGGLLGKLLIQKLEAEGKAGLIDNFIMIGTPQLGTPQAVTTLLHGHQTIPMEFFTRSHVSRAIGQNMQTVYDLLPSERYFAEVIDPVLSFNESADFTQDWWNRWGTTTDEYWEFAEFITGGGVTRDDPQATNLAVPEIVRSDLVANADALHDSLDTYVFPESIRIVQIAGWGLPTLKGIEYKKKHIFFDGYDADFTTEGDSTVVYPSVIVVDGQESYYFNLATYNALDDVTNHEHRNLTSAKPVESIIDAVLRGVSVSFDYISTTKPDPGSVEDRLVVSTKSPVVLGVYDADSNFTGVNPNQELTLDSLVVEENIPGSTFLAAGEDLYLFLPKNGSYTFVFKGVGVGPATVEVGTFTNDTLILEDSYSEIPVTPTTEGNFTLSATSTEAFIAIDNNGDGQIDTTVVPDGYMPSPTLAELIATLKVTIQSLDVKLKLKDKFLKKVEKIEKKVSKDRTAKAGKVLVNLSEKVTKKAGKGEISDIEAGKILDLLEQIGNAL